MPTAISHGFVALVFGKIFAKSSSSKFWLFSIICAILPDVDVVLLSFGIPLEHSFGHRGFTHSILFASLVALVVVLGFFREFKYNTKIWWQFVVYFFVIILFHDILDAMTSGGQGVGFFIPFDSTRYFFPFRPIRVSPLSIIRLFGTGGEKIAISEIVWVWLPAILLLVIVRLIRHRNVITQKNNKRQVV